MDVRKPMRTTKDSWRHARTWTKFSAKVREDGLFDLETRFSSNSLTLILKFESYLFLSPFSKCRVLCRQKCTIKKFQKVTWRWAPFAKVCRQTPWRPFGGFRLGRCSADEWGDVPRWLEWCLEYRWVWNFLLQVLCRLQTTWKRKERNTTNTSALPHAFYVTNPSRTHAIASFTRNSDDWVIANVNFWEKAYFLSLKTAE